jgi:hypothetical protein
MIEIGKNSKFFAWRFSFVEFFDHLGDHSKKSQQFFGTKLKYAKFQFFP